MLDRISPRHFILCFVFPNLHCCDRNPLLLVLPAADEPVSLLLVFYIFEHVTVLILSVFLHWTLCPPLASDYSLAFVWTTWKKSQFFPEDWNPRLGLVFWLRFFESSLGWEDCRVCLHTPVLRKLPCTLSNSPGWSWGTAVTAFANIPRKAGGLPDCWFTCILAVCETSFWAAQQSAVSRCCYCRGSWHFYCFFWCRSWRSNLIPGGWNHCETSVVNATALGWPNFETFLKPLFLPCVVISDSNVFYWHWRITLESVNKLNSVVMLELKQKP